VVGVDDEVEAQELDRLRAAEACGAAARHRGGSEEAALAATRRRAQRHPLPVDACAARAGAAEPGRWLLRRRRAWRILAVKAVLWRTAGERTVA
jgi:hypothetical protein